MVCWYLPVLAILLGTAVSDSSSQSHCRVNFLRHLSTHVSNCDGHQSCREKAETILREYQECTGGVSLSQSLTPVTDLMKGVFEGFEANPAVPSSCVTSLTAPSVYWSLFVSTIETMFSADGNLPDIFIALSLFDQYLTEFLGNVERCDFSSLSDHWAQLLTWEGVFKAMYVVGTEINLVAVRTRQDSYYLFFEDLLNGYYESAGMNLGKILSILLNYQI